jgi:hypothetical protein
VILDAWVKSLFDENVYARQISRLPSILSRISYNCVKQWSEHPTHDWELPEYIMVKKTDNSEIYRLLRQGEILEVEKNLSVLPLFDSNLIVLSRLVEIFHNEVNFESANTIFDYSTDIYELVRHYTKTKLMLRRIEFDMPSEYIDEFYDYCEENNVSVYMLAQFVLTNLDDKKKVCKGLVDLYSGKKGPQSMQAVYFTWLYNQIREECPQ